MGINENMLNKEVKLPLFVRNIRIFHERKDIFIQQHVNNLFEQSSSQDIAVSYSQLLQFVQYNDYVDKKLSHRNKKQLSSWRILKNLNNNLKELQKDNSRETFDQRVMIVASVMCPRYGVPNVDETRTVIEAATNVHRDLLTGKKQNLSVGPQKKKEFYPKEVEELATECWMNEATIVEPS